MEEKYKVTRVWSDLVQIAPCPLLVDANPFNDLDRIAERFGAKFIAYKSEFEVLSFEIPGEYLSLPCPWELLSAVDLFHSYVSRRLPFYSEESMKRQLSSLRNEVIVLRTESHNAKRSIADLTADLESARRTIDGLERRQRRSKKRGPFRVK